MMGHPQRIRLSRAKGWRMPPDTVSVARPGPWGNPFVVGEYGTRAQCVWKFALLAAGGFVDLGCNMEPDAQLRLWRKVRRDIAALHGKNLACWCSLDGPCHADVLLILANDGTTASLNALSVDLPRVGICASARDLEKMKRKRARSAT
jgi:hypothetical protein